MEDTKIDTFAKWLLVLLEELQGTTSGFEVLKLAKDIQKAARIVTRFERNKLNRPTTEAEAQRAAKAEARLLKLARAYGLTLKTDGDPRGSAVALVLKSRRSNNMGGEDWQVPA